jgi:hypothetical protein
MLLLGKISEGSTAGEKYFFKILKKKLLSPNHKWKTAKKRKK